jgi:hypothetical protein
MSNGAVCIMIGLTPIAIQIEESFQIYKLTRGRTKAEAVVDLNMEVRYWLHPAHKTQFRTETNAQPITLQMFTDGGRRRHSHIQIR